MVYQWKGAACIFLSTLSLRRATSSLYLPLLFGLHFYPRSPCGERLCNMHSLRYCCTNFYPRSPCGERPRSGRPCRAVHKFLSTLSLRRATGGRRAIDPETGISIHALLAESDFMQQLFAMQQQAFLSTLSLRRATYRLLRLPHRQAISIHALLAESDEKREDMDYDD